MNNGLPLNPALARSRGIRLPFFYGWVLVVIAFVTMAVGVNARTAFSLLFPAILDEFGWVRGVLQREGSARVDPNGHRHERNGNQDPAVEKRQTDTARKGKHSI